MAAVTDPPRNSLLVSTSPFDQALAKFKTQLSEKEVDDFQLTSADDLKKAILQLQEQQASVKGMQNLQRLTAFVEAMDQFDKVIQVFLNASDYLGFVWGPAKFMLLVAGSHADALNTLLEAYREIGEQMPLLPQYESLTDSGPYVHHVLGYLYTDILEFHRKAMKHFRQRAWKQLFHATWKTFRANFDGILSNLRSHRDLLNSQTILVGVQETRRAIEELRELRTTVETRWQQTQHEETERRRRAIMQWLSVDDSSLDHEHARSVLKDDPDSGSWLLEQDLVKDWLDLHTSAQPLLWINGKPGAGKTILTSVLIERCRRTPDSTVAYFYCKHDRSDRNNFISFSCSIILQLSFMNRSLQAFILDQMASSGTEKLRSPKAAKEILNVALASIDGLFLIIDGIDECLKAEKNEISSWARSAFSARPSSMPNAPRCCFISQHDNHTGKLFKTIPTMNITAKHNKEEILRYCRFQAESIGDEFELEPKEIQDLAGNVCNNADGMFLYAKLVMENLLNQVSKAMLKKEMEEIPPTLNEIYDRLLHRILNENSHPDRETTKVLLIWLLCAKRPLKWHEIQGAICVNVEDATFDPDRRLVKDLKHFCGSLVEVRQGGAITFVHLTARLFLQNQPSLPRQLEQCNMTRICFSHLALDSHDSEITEDSIQHYVLRGEYSFTEYAIAHAFSHLHDTCLEIKISSGPRYADLCETLRLFLGKRLCTSANRSTAKSVDKSLGIFKKEPFFQGVQLAATYIQRLFERVTTADGDNEPILMLDMQLVKARQVLENMATVLGLGSSLESLYGRNIFKCSVAHCQSFHEGFPTEKSRDKHGEDHENTWLCPTSGCPFSLNGFRSASELETHKQNVHAESIHDESFPWYGTPSSINVGDEIGRSNVIAFEVWMSQWDGKAPPHEVTLWFGDTLSKGPLDKARDAGQRKMMEIVFDHIDWNALSAQRIRSFLIRTLNFHDEQTAATVLRRFTKFSDVDIFKLSITTLSLGLDSTAGKLFMHQSSSLSDPTKRKRHSTYLSLTIKYGRQAIFRQLLTEFSVDPRTEDDKGRNSMTAAAEFDRKDMAHYLIERLQCDKWTATKKGDTALRMASRQGHEDFILSVFSEPERDQETRVWLRTAQFRNAVYAGNYEKVVELLEGEDLQVDQMDSQNYTPWLWAVRKGHTHLVQLFLDKFDASVVSFGRHYKSGEYQCGSAVHYAASVGYDSILRLLLQSSKFDEELNVSSMVLGTDGKGHPPFFKPLGHATKLDKKDTATIIEDYMGALRTKNSEGFTNTRAP